MESAEFSHLFTIQIFDAFCIAVDLRYFPGSVAISILLENVGAKLHQCPDDRQMSRFSSRMQTVPAVIHLGK